MVNFHIRIRCIGQLRFTSSIRIRGDSEHPFLPAFAAAAQLSKQISRNDAALGWEHIQDSTWTASPIKWQRNGALKCVTSEADLPSMMRTIHFQKVCPSLWLSTRH